MSGNFFVRLLATILLTTVSLAEAQQPVKVHRIGYISGRSGPGPLDEVFKIALRELGYVEGQNVTFTYRWAEEKLDRLPALAVELVQLKVDVIVTETTPAAQAAKKATADIPIVMTLSGDPVGAGLVASLARPGANITGLTFIGTDLGGKWVELLKEMSPKTSHLAYLANPELTPDVLVFKSMQPVAQELGMTIKSVDARSLNDFKRAFSELKQARVDGLVVSANVIYVQNRKLIVDLVAQQRLPAIYGRSDFVDAGGLASYGTSFPDLYRRAATYVDKILKGATPADLPVEQPKKFEFIINLKAAKQIGLTIPPNVLARADRVIR
ncbi:MAG TPA: ABC transporter substrate-binding protein [Candidatus Binatia bacterium]|jgi:putative ABC transport system substrate-binding protein|nr:ABC transporter substrate-binding protein [Candidatus Binatia bacterium]